MAAVMADLARKSRRDSTVLDGLEMEKAAAVPAMRSVVMMMG